MSYLLLKRLRNNNSLQNPTLTIYLLNRLFSSFSNPHSQKFPIPIHNQSVPDTSLVKKRNGFSSCYFDNSKILCGLRLWSSQAAPEASSSDGLTVEGIVANNWVIYDEDESDWKSHASAIAQSIHLIKKRLRVCFPDSNSCPLYLDLVADSK